MQHTPLISNNIKCVYAKLENNKCIIIVNVISHIVLYTDKLLKLRACCVCTLCVNLFFFFFQYWETAISILELGYSQACAAKIKSKINRVK